MRGNKDIGIIVFGGKRAHVSPDDKRSTPPIGTCNARGVTGALPEF